LIGKNLVGALKATGQHEQAALILKACEPIEKSQVIMN